MPNAFSRIFRTKKKGHLPFATVAEGLKFMYKEKLLPLEEKYNFHDLVSPPLNDADFDGKPMIMFIGAYSTGKTTFIRYILNRDYPGMRIAVEPSTDKFHVVSYGEAEIEILGNVLTADTKMQFMPLAKYGSEFLSKFQASLVKSEVLTNVTMIDTPGILAKQRDDRNYDFIAVLKWFAERVDKIIILFDAQKLDMSDEFRSAIDAIKGHESKMMFVLNKVDTISYTELVHVFGGLMWSISKILISPECPNVYVGSFWDQPIVHECYRTMFEGDYRSIMKSITDLPKTVSKRKLDDFVKRARQAIVHAKLISEIRQSIPLYAIVMKDNQRNQLKNLECIYRKLEKTQGIPRSDLPDIADLKRKLAYTNLRDLPKYDKKLINKAQQMINVEVSVLINDFPVDLNEQVLKGGILSGVNDSSTPFGYQMCEGMNLGKGDDEWIVNKNRAASDIIFKSLNKSDGKVGGLTAKNELMKSRLPDAVLNQIYSLADTDGDKYLDADEFALAMHLVQIKLDGYDLMETLPDHLIPPSKIKAVSPKSTPDHDSNIIPIIKY